MKRAIVALFTAAMLLTSTAATTTTFLAAPSVSAGDVTSNTTTTKKESITTAEIKVEKKTVSGATATGTNAKVEIKADVSITVENSLKDVIINNLAPKSDSGKVLTAAKILSLVDISIPDATDEELKNGIEVTLNIPDFKQESGKGYKLLHYTDGGWKEETITSIANGKITAKFHSFSPVSIVEYEIATVSASGDSTTGGSTGNGSSTVPTSPKGGVGVSTAALIAAAGLAGAVVCKKKSN